MKHYNIMTGEPAGGLKTKANNTVNVLNLYRTKNGIWCFDDEDLQIIAEPFVGDINTMIDMFAKGKEEVVAYISAEPIANGTLSLTRNDEAEYEGMYKLDGTDVEGWLCPCTLNYFKIYPEKIYALIKA